MAELAKKIKYKKSGTTYEAKLYSSLADLSDQSLRFTAKVDGMNAYAQMTTVGSMDGTHLRVRKSGVNYQVQKQSIDMSTFIVLTVNIPSSANICRITTLVIAGKNFTVNWGDGTIENYAGEIGGHAYGSYNATYTITITGHVTKVSGQLRQGVGVDGTGRGDYSALTYITSVSSLRSSTINSVGFTHSPNLTAINNIFLPNLTMLNEAFNNCPSYNVSNFNFAIFPQLIDAHFLFTDNRTSNYYDWEVRKNVLASLPKGVTTLRGMFEGCRNMKNLFSTWQAAYADIELLLNTFPNLTDKDKILNRWGNSSW